MSRVGVMGEDRTDTDTLTVLVRRIVPGVGVDARAPAVGKAGCAALRKRAPDFARELVAHGCSALVLVHDLDRDGNNGELKDEEELRRALARLIPAELGPRLICIPVEEMEAWFWACQTALDRVGKGFARASASPHLVKQPKEALVRLSARAHRKPVYSTNMNRAMAEVLDLDSCTARCPSFRGLREFLGRQFPTG